MFPKTAVDLETDHAESGGTTQAFMIGQQAPKIKMSEENWGTLIWCDVTLSIGV